MTTKVEKLNKTSDGESPKKKKRAKFKIPGAVTILVGVAFVAILVTWIVHFATTGMYLQNPEKLILVFTSSSITDDGVTTTGYLVTSYEGGNNWYINEGANVLLNGQWIQLNVDQLILAAEKVNSKEIYTPTLGTIVAEEWETIHGQLVYGNIIANAWYNFADSNWYVSGDGMYGFGDIVKSTIAGFFSAADLIFFTIGIGVMIEILMETEVLKGLVNSMIKGLNNKRLLLAPALFIVFSLWGTMLGTQEATLALMPIIVPALIIAGFDAMTGFLIILVGCTTGIAASILEPFALSTLAAEFHNVWAKLIEANPTWNDTGVANIGIGTGIGLRTTLFIVYTAMGCGFVTWYGSRVLKKPENSVEDSQMLADNKEWAKISLGEEDHKSMNKKQKWGLVILSSTVLWMIFCLLPWSTWLGPEIVNGMFWTTLSHLFFYSTEFGGWTFIQLGLTFSFGWFICAKMFNYTNSQMINNWKNAWKTFGTIAIILTMSRATSIILTNSGNAEFLAKGIFSSVTQNMSGGGLALTVFPVYVLMALFIPSMSGLAGISAPIIGALFNNNMDSSTVLIAMTGILALYPLAQGIVNMVSPTTGLVVAQAEASNTSYAKAVPLLAGFAASITVVGLTVVSLFMFVIM